MKTLLRIDASARLEGSSSRQLADHYQARWTAAHPGARVLVRDLARSPVPHLDAATIAAFYGAPVDEGARPAGLALSDVLIAELRAADRVLISSALYNQSLPSTLKAWIDHVVRNGHTFESREGRPVGLLGGTPVTIVVARGGVTSGLVDDFETPYLRAILGFVGITDIEVIPVEATAHDEASRALRFAAAWAEVDRRIDASG
ncbi:FMN-dependent NADH-azoreductase [Nannocystis bainbridge]|uniref:FMN dependent NADH:quinone oxidoreductase n=1 Tax=Nannocystis bainbridge TaxID=2995303 RepID=A0ABT5EBH1_9BACT|nr:NAD(P)H-dependent oxidoreductase [Nannocystis bainbridge]MDC0723217.1 NAD(P)H-dependent oxidoreductase [Nannocystis bainbridge]